MLFYLPGHFDDDRAHALLLAPSTCQAALARYKSNPHDTLLCALQLLKQSRQQLQQQLQSAPVLKSLQVSHRLKQSLQQNAPAGNRAVSRATAHHSRVTQCEQALWQNVSFLVSAESTQILVLVCVHGPSKVNCTLMPALTDMNEKPCC